MSAFASACDSGDGFDVEASQPVSVVNHVLLCLARRDFNIFWKRRWHNRRKALRSAVVFAGASRDGTFPKLDDITHWAHRVGFQRAITAFEESECGAVLLKETLMSAFASACDSGHGFDVVASQPVSVV